MLKEITDEQERNSLIALYNEKQIQPIQGTPFLKLLKKKKTVEIDGKDDFKTEFVSRLNQIKQQRNEELQVLKQKESSLKDE